MNLFRPTCKNDVWNFIWCSNSQITFMGNLLFWTSERYAHVTNFHYLLQLTLMLSIIMNDTVLCGMQILDVRKWNAWRDENIWTHCACISGLQPRLWFPCSALEPMSCWETNSQHQRSKIYSFSIFTPQNELFLIPLPGTCFFQVFTSIALFNILINPLNSLPWVGKIW